MTDIYGLTLKKLADKLTELGEKPSRADIIFPAVYGELARSFDGLPLKQETLCTLAENFSFGGPECIEKLVSETADKYLFRLSDGNTIESVLMKHEFGYNVCVSTQVGCNMGCRFCASGRLKKVRDLTVSEMVGQLIHIRRDIGTRLGGISVMGIGEPLENLANVLDFIDIAQYPKGFDIGIKHITLSTCGLVPGIYKLADSSAPVNLAVSLHAPDDALRRTIMPSANKYALNDIIAAARYYSEKNNRRVTFEYVMLDGVNDSDECAARLAELISGLNCYVNIIRYNPTDGSPFSCSPHERIMSFYDILKKHGIGVTMRRELGASVNAACGQLRAASLGG
ncbi:MAG: 23S rRNA (adenine(2503)-C(2))-methyltransferase RlmN [Ruminiclostridium sp.]|nr:23S rRNA (adenine(2503)-C(2))-methyltransferase RlmN [Ruminiclostridium sp.]